ncbi:MAG: hypothetical protein QM774_12350 [Gordonia sp. (in: high G+C Gram-positive bacteria)]|uniref:hypothetical protein n=1 Tax=Gordonia sp. (in: high G+C Gram-positive bacteria) TaxID=84139 RepID=UPI0039E28DA2
MTQPPEEPAQAAPDDDPKTELTDTGGSQPYSAPQAYGQAAYSGQTSAQPYNGQQGEPYAEQQFQEAQHEQQYVQPEYPPQEYPQSGAGYGYVDPATNPQTPPGHPVTDPDQTVAVTAAGAGVANETAKAVRRWQIIAGLGVGAAALIGLSFVLFGSLEGKPGATVTSTVTTTETPSATSSVITRNRTTTVTGQDRTETDTATRTATVTQNNTVTRTVTRTQVDTTTTTVYTPSPAPASPAG